MRVIEYNQQVGLLLAYQIKHAYKLFPDDCSRKDRILGGLKTTLLTLITGWWSGRSLVSLNWYAIAKNCCGGFDVTHRSRFDDNNQLQVDQNASGSDMIKIVVLGALFNLITFALLLWVIFKILVL